MSATRPPAFDDRFSTPIEASRRGAHRARPRPASAGLPVAAGAAVILLVLGGGYVMLSNSSEVDDSSKVSAAAVDAEESATATAAADDGADAAADPAATTAADDPAATATEAPAKTTKVNREVSLKVLNSTSTAGLASQVQANIETEGWQVQETGNSINRGLSVTKIYYGRVSMKATAQALKKDLGFGRIARDTSVVSSEFPIIVVLGVDAS